MKNVSDKIVDEIETHQYFFFENHAVSDVEKCLKPYRSHIAMRRMCVAR
jgi:hypothetical protein